MTPAGTDVLRRIVAEGRSGVVNQGGARYLVIQGATSDAGWRFSFLTPYRSLGRDAGGILRATAVVVGGCVVLLAILIWVFSRTFVGRIHQLNQSMQAVAEGDLHADIHSNTKDEIGELTNRFGSMVKRINSLITEVYKSRIVRREAEIRALQAQINPHFLYNTLSLINWKAKLIEATEICDIVRAMTKYFRTTLSKGHDVITVRAELENVRSYVYIQQALHDRSFSVEYQVDQAVYPYYTLKLLLQPIVENAILHGLDRSKRPGKHLIVAAEKREERIVFTVSDDGAGMPAGAAAEAETFGNGYGLRNVRERIRHFFGEDYGVQVMSAIGRGTTATITIPAYRLPEVAAEPSTLSGSSG
jgi:two-component system sensor histidine kinase YesM